jgi:hypothetical protein
MPKLLEEEAVAKAKAGIASGKTGSGREAVPVA